MLESGDEVGPWIVLRYLGAGRSGTVYEVCRKGSPERHAALKINCGVSVVATPAQFDRELGIVRKDLIPGYRPAYYGSGEHKGKKYYAMQLAQKLPKRLSRILLKRVVVRIAKALSALHETGFLHCDVKPDNIALIDGEAVLLDMGSVRTIDTAREDARRVGTWEFMAPEVRESRRLDERADIYSLGVTLEKLAGKRFARTYESLVNHAKQNEPKNRPKTMDEFLREFTSSQDRLAKFVRVGLWSVTIALGGLVLFTAFNVYLTKSRERQVDQDCHTVLGLRATIIAGLEQFDEGEHESAVKNLQSATNHRDFAELGVRQGEVLQRLKEYEQKIRYGSEPPQRRSSSSSVKTCPQ